MYDRDALIALIREQALKFGDFTLASGKKASFYLDCRQVTLDSAGANLIAAGILDVIGDDPPDAVGGMAIGADPITGAVITLAGTRGIPMKGFIVRKESKEHGTARMVEGPVRAGQRVVIVEDVVTTGGSSLQAISAVEELGCSVVRVLAIVDREEGGKENLSQKGYRLEAIFTAEELLSLV